jgi:thymidylate synthase (FAD)
MKEAKLKVILLGWTKDAEKIVSAAIRQCYSAVGASDLRKKITSQKQKELIKMVLSSGHTSTLEHASFTFAVEGISRVCSHQLVRHRLASYSQQSRRYIDFSKGGINFIVPPSIKGKRGLLKEFKRAIKNAEEAYFSLRKKGIAAEDARFVLQMQRKQKLW